MKKHLLLLIVLTAIIRLTFLSKLPPALYGDETAIGYNAYSILKTGKDEWGEKLPVYFKSYGDYKLPLYIYTTAFFEKILGVNEWAVRLPSALSGIIGVGLFFLIVYKLSKNLKLSFFSGLLLAINPQHIFFSRAGFEVNLSLTLILAGVYFFILFSKNKSSNLLLISSIFFTLATYTYNVARLISPLIFLFLVFKNKTTVFKLKKKQLFLIFLINLTLLFPFIKVFFSPLGQKTAKGEVIFLSPYVLAENIRFRANLMEGLNPTAVKLLFNKYAFFIFKYFQNLASIMNFDFFFVKGSSHPNHGTGHTGFLYLFELSFVIAGFVYSVLKFKQNKGLKLFLGWFLISYFVLALSRQVPHATRGYFLIIPLVYFSSLGLYLFFKKIKTFSSLKRKLILTTFLTFSLYNLLYFFLSYTLVFPREKAQAWGVHQKKLALYIAKNYDKYEKILIDDKAGVSYTALAFYLKLDPKKFQKTAKYIKSGDLYKAVEFDKFKVKNIDLNRDLKKGILLILDGLALPSKGKITKIKLPKKHIALSLQDKIIQWPEEKTMFIIVEP